MQTECTVSVYSQSYNSVHTHWNDLRAALGVDPFPSLTAIDKEKIVSVGQRAKRLSSGETGGNSPSPDCEPEEGAHA